jgi:bifunctional non-homologous end joining protein LigD
MLPPFLDPCLPTRVPVAPSGPAWLHEIKHDGYRLMVRRTPEGVRIKTRRGYDWTDRYPRIVKVAGALRATSFVIDGEGAILRPDGVTGWECPACALDRVRTPDMVADDLRTTASCSANAWTRLGCAERIVRSTIVIPASRRHT